MILDGVDQPVIVTRANGIIAEFNAAAARLTGYAAGEVIERVPLTLLYDSPQIAARARALSDAHGVWVEPGFDTLVMEASSHAVPKHEWTYVRKDGRRISVSVSLRALRGARGVLEGYLVLPSEPLATPTALARDGAGAARVPAAPAREEAADERGGSPCFAPSDALRRLNGDSALLDELVALFQRDRAGLRDDIQRAIDNRDTVAIERGAHRLRSALLNLAAGPAAQAARSLEDSGRRGFLPRPEQLAWLSAELDRLSEALSSFRGAPG